METAIRFPVFFPGTRKPSPIKKKFFFEVLNIAEGAGVGRLGHTRPVPVEVGLAAGMLFFHVEEKLANTKREPCERAPKDVMRTAFAEGEWWRNPGEGRGKEPTRRGVGGVAPNARKTRAAKMKIRNIFLFWKKMELFLLKHSEL